MSHLDARREELRARQGAGARYDSPDAPAEALDLTRRGTAYFTRLLNGLSDRNLAMPVAGWPARAHLVAFVALQARRMSEALSALRHGRAQFRHGVLTIERPSLDAAASLPPRALRNLFAHSEVHLNVEFRDLTGDHWRAALPASERPALPVAELPNLRAVTLWRASFQLDAGARATDCPSALMESVTGSDTLGPLASGT